MPRDELLEKGMLVEFGRCVSVQKMVTKFPEGLCSDGVVASIVVTEIKENVEI